MNDIDRIITYGNLITQSPRRMGKLTGITKVDRDLVDYVFIIFLIVTVVSVGLTIYYMIEISLHCAMWEKKIVHQNAWTQFIYTGKVMVPIYHPAGDYERNVCVKPK